MKEKNLLASVALFSELYNSNTYKSILDIIAEFIKGAVIYEGKNTFNSTELKGLLNKVYGFDIPESVIRTTLQNKFKEEVTKVNSTYTFNENIEKGFEKIKVEYKTISENQNQIINSLYNYIEEKEKHKLDESKKKEVFENFNHFLMDNGYSDKFSNHISAFVIKNELTPNFKDTLNSIKEGVILYQGINFTGDLNELGKWNTNLTLYLSTEHLFSALGYNGILFKEIFDDFFKLVTEINQNNKLVNDKQKSKVQLKYLSETKEEVDKFFSTAELIKKGVMALDPSKLAMEKILENSKTIADIKVKRIKLESDLTLMGITQEEFTFEIYKHQKYNVEDLSVIKQLKANSKSKGKVFNEELSAHYFRIFSKINAFRKGVSNVPFEKIGHLYVTETSFARYLAHNNTVKFGDYDTPFTKDIDFVTTRFWFKLKKGFSNKQTLPKSFDVITKARIILSSHLNNSLSLEYEKLVKEKKEGKLSDKEAIERSYLLREKSNAPEQINIDNIDVTLDFLTNNHYLEDYQREKTKKDNLLKDTLSENDLLKQKLQEIKDKEAKELQDKKDKDFKQRKEKYINENLIAIKRKNFYDLMFLVTIFFINSYLAFFTVFMAISKGFKDWLGEFGFLQILLISIYLLLIITELLGRSYFFNKEKLKSGLNWLKIIASSNKKYDYEQEVMNKLGAKFK